MSLGRTCLTTLGCLLACGDSDDLACPRAPRAVRVAAAESGELLYTADGRLHMVSLATPGTVDPAYGPSILEWHSGWDGASWQETGELDADGEDQSQPALALADGAIHAVWSSSWTDGETDRRDLFLATLGASGWSAPVNLTGSGAEAGSHIALGGDLAAGGDGQLAVVYGWQAVESADVHELRVARVVDGALSGEPVTVAGPCDSGGGRRPARAAIAFDGTGAIHVLASCSPEGGAFELLWATDAGGEWRTVQLPARTSAIRPDLVVDADGIPNALFTEFVDYDNTRLVHLRLVAGEWSQAVAVAENASVGRIAFAPDGRTVVAYAGRPRSLNAFVTWSDGSGFTEPCAIELPLDDVPTTISLALDRETGAPTVVAGAPFSGDEDDSLAIGWFAP